MRNLLCLLLFLFGVFMSVPMTAEACGAAVAAEDAVSDGPHPQAGEPDAIARDFVFKTLYSSGHETQTPPAPFVFPARQAEFWRPPMVHP